MMNSHLRNQLWITSRDHDLICGIYTLYKSEKPMRFHEAMSMRNISLKSLYISYDFILNQLNDSIWQ